MIINNKFIKKKLQMDLQHLQIFFPTLFTNLMILCIANKFIDQEDGESLAIVPSLVLDKFTYN